MEVVLLWLDDLDDLLFSLALLFESVRRSVLQIGLGAAFALAASERFAALADLAPTLVCLSAMSVAVWLIGAAFRAYYYRSRFSMA